MCLFGQIQISNARTQVLNTTSFKGISEANAITWHYINAPTPSHKIFEQYVFIPFLKSGKNSSPDQQILPVGAAKNGTELSFGFVGYEAIASKFVPVRPTRRES